MDLREVVTEFGARRGRWIELGWQPTISAVADPPKGAVVIRAETAAVLVELIIWETGEAELIHGDVATGEAMTDQYEITGGIGLAGCLDDLESIMQPDE